MLAGLRHGRTLGTPLALVVRNRDHDNRAWGMSPWPPEGEPQGKGAKPVTLPRPGPRRSRRRIQVRPPRRARRTRARERAATLRQSSRRVQLRKRCCRRLGSQLDSRVSATISSSAWTKRAPTATPSAAHRGSCARRSPRSRVVRDERRSPRRTARATLMGPGSERCRDRRGLAALQTSGGRRRTTRSFATRMAFTARRIEPAASRAACRTARRSSCVPP